MPPFWRVAYHTVFFLDLYASDTAEGFAPPAPFTLDELDASDPTPDRVYTREELRGNLMTAREKCRARIETCDDSQAGRHGRFAWLNMGDAEVLLYSMRHVQHHAAQLNVLLRQEIDASPGWVRAAAPRREGA